MQNTLHILAEEDWGKLVIGVIVVIVWIANGIAGAMKRKPGDKMPAPANSQNALEAFQREVAERIRQGQAQRPVPPPPPLMPIPQATNLQLAAMQRRQAIQRQQQAMQLAAPSQRAVNPPAMAHPELAAMQRRQAAQRKQTAARQAQKPAPPAIPTAPRKAIPVATPAPAAVAEVMPRASRQELPPVNAAVIAAWMKPQTLRKQFIITEIFQPPLSMRDRSAD